MVMQACKLNLLQLHPSSEVSSLLFEPSSRSLALMLSDSSLLLYPSISVFTPPGSPPPSLFPRPTVISPISTSSAFLRLHDSPNTDPRILFLSAGPHLSSVLLRAWILSPSYAFTRVKLKFKEDLKSSVDLRLRHGISLTLAASVNVFVMHLPFERKICVFAVKLIGEDAVSLMKCATIECTVPIYSLRVSAGFLILGEENGVRVFPVRPLVKGRVEKKKDNAGRKQGAGLNVELIKTLPRKRQNGYILRTDVRYVGSASNLKSGMECYNSPSSRLENGGDLSGRGSREIVDVDPSSTKRLTVKVRQVSGELGSFFVPFNSMEVQTGKCKPKILASLKAVSIHYLSQKKFLVLDSHGDLHTLSLHNHSFGPETGVPSVLAVDGHIRRLDYSMKVHMLAVLPDVSSRSQTLWLSDGSHSVHTTSVADADFIVHENDKDETKEKLMQISASQAIFTSEKIQDVVPLASNAILVLGQGSIFGYSIP